MKREASDILADLFWRCPRNGKRVDSGHDATALDGVWEGDPNQYSQARRPASRFGTDLRWADVGRRVHLSHVAYPIPSPSEVSVELIVL